MTISAAVQSMNGHPIQNSGPTVSGSEKTVSGTVSSSKNGEGTFSKMLEEVNGQKMVDKTVTYANGKTMESQTTITNNSEGSKTITREKTNAHGGVTKMTDTETKSATGQINQSITSTNAKGQTETLDRVTTNINGARTVTTTGTGYDGSTINNETTWTTLA